jgi:hypothetical protein
MGRYKKNSDHGELEFTRAAYDTIEDYVSDHSVAVKHSIWPTEQRGVLAFVSAVYLDNVTSVGRPIVTQTDYWPSATDCSWAAFWFQHSFKTARMVEAWMQAEETRRSEQKP